MSKTNNLINTPGGNPAVLGNPPSLEVGSMDSGVSQLLLDNNPFGRSSKLSRSPSHTSGGDIKEYEKENAELRRRLGEIEKMTSQLCLEIEKLKIENEQLKKSNQNEAPETSLLNSNVVNSEYYTDEEELARETEWILQKRKKKTRQNKKRKAESSPEGAESSLLKAVRQSGSKEVETSAIQEAAKSVVQLEKQPVKRKEKAPPPINIVGVTNYATVQSIIKSVTYKEYRIISLNNNMWKINTADPESYRALTAKLREEKVEFYTYEDKHNRPIKVMARGLHPTCLTEDIMQDLRQRDLQIEDVVNIVKREKTQDEQGVRINKRGLPLFMLTFNSSEKLDNIFNIKSILHMRVKIEALRKSSGLIPQCKKCQGFNHTRKYCGREPRCVRCAGKHASQDCPANKVTPPKCINCKEQHPANYRGCEVAKELQKQRNRQRPSQNKGVSGVRIQTQARSENQANKFDERKSYSQILQQAPSMTEGSSDNQVLQKILRSIQDMNVRLVKQERCLEALNKRLDKQYTVNEVTSLIY